MTLPAISKKEKFFIEGSGTARIYGDEIKSHLIYLQDMTLEITASTDHVFNGVSDFSQYEYITEKTAKVTFTNASWSLTDVSLMQEAPPDAEVFDFVEETLSTNSEGVLTMSNQNIDRDSFMVFDSNDAVVPILDMDSGAGVCTLDGGYSDQTVTAAYNYIADSSTGISASVYTASIPRFVMIRHQSKPIFQNDGRYIRVITTIFKARSNGQWTFNLKHKTAFAPELTFDIIDPNRDDGRLMIFAIKDVSVEEEDLQPAGGSDDDIDPRFRYTPDDIEYGIIRLFRSSNNEGWTAIDDNFTLPAADFSYTLDDIEYGISYNTLEADSSFEWHRQE